MLEDVVFDRSTYYLLENLEELNAEEIEESLKAFLEENYVSLKLKVEEWSDGKYKISAPRKGHFIIRAYDITPEELVKQLQEVF